MRTLLFTTTMLIAGCTTPSQVKEPVRAPPSREPTKETVKPGAPTVVAKEEVTSTSASVLLRFEGSGENVTVQAAGLEGVTLSSPAEVVMSRSVKAGDELPIALTFQAAHRGHLVLTVRGTFNGAEQSRVHTLLVGEGPLKDDGAKVQVTSDGDAVKLIP